jgi:3-oxoacyl-(acyl-carrier-protein) synthase
MIGHCLGAAGGIEAIARITIALARMLLLALDIGAILQYDNKNDNPRSGPVLQLAAGNPAKPLGA